MRGIVGYTGVQSAAPILPEEYLPFIAAENIMMEAVRRGGDRQKIHGIIRRCCSRRVTSADAKNKRQDIYRVSHTDRRFRPRCGRYRELKEAAYG